jgi:CelD/BcsL family acetyltransferase involved in cellulose biosynthesis
MTHKAVLSDVFGITAVVPYSSEPPKPRFPSRGTLNAELRFAARMHNSIETVAGTWRCFEAMGACTAFQQLAWANCIRDWLVDPANATMFVVEVFDSATQRALMLFPLVRVRRWGCVVVEWLDLGVSDYAAPILAPGLVLSTEEVNAAWCAAKSALPKMDVIHISRIPAEISGATNPLALLPTCRRMDMECFGVSLSGDPDTLIERLCRKSTYRDFAKFRRRMARQGVVTLKCATTLEEANELFDVLLEQRRSRFRDIGRFDLLARNEFVIFYRKALLDGLKGGPVRIFGLRVGEQYVATAYGMIHRNAFHLLIQTMDTGEQWRNSSPGLQVTADVMKWSLSNGLEFFDFTIGMLTYKVELGALPRPMFEIREPRTLRGIAITRFALSKSMTKAWIRRHSRMFLILRETRRALRRLVKASSVKP